MGRALRGVRAFNDRAVLFFLLLTLALPQRGNLRRFSPIQPKNHPDCSLSRRSPDFIAHFALQFFISPRTAGSRAAFIA
jgi:hypothetical protein